ncbi:type II secretion system F family protein [Halorussus halophilus]|uniref:type II secretion system F family protein n=1 Tax=Halorussus halophilus TaxID=2650975 RepID=UPI0013011E36|nr:type II secretion system F family protein [Halorussus halophilus]
MFEYVPLVAVGLVWLSIGVAAIDRRVNRVVTRVALTLFGGYVTDNGRRRARRQRLLQSVHVAETYRMYAAKTVLYAAIAAVTGSVIGVYLVGAGLAVISISSETVRATLPSQLGPLATVFGDPNLSVGQLFALLLASSATVGLGAGTLTYWIRWENLSYRANTRERQIDESLARTVAFVYALSRSGMAFPEIMRTLARNQDVYGEAAAEVAVAVKSMDIAGLDMLSAIERLGEQTPSEKFEEFSDNLASVLRSGQSVPSYLADQYDRFQQEAEDQQESFLELLATLAEAYVSVFVVAPLLFITILVIMGLMGLGNTLTLLQVITYFAIPLANVGFVVYLDSITESLAATRGSRDVQSVVGVLADLRGTDDPTSERVGDERPTLSALGVVENEVRSDGGTTTDTTTTAKTTATDNFERLAAFERIWWFRKALSDPIHTIRDNPVYVLYATIPLGLLSVLLRSWPHLAAGTLTARVVDDFVVQAGLVVVGSFALVQEIHRRRLSAIERAVPDFLDRLASVNEAGMSIVESLGRVRKGDLGALDVEVERIWADLRWGADAETALYRFEDRIDTPIITRMVSLIANAMRASGDLAPVLRIAAEEAQDTRRLKRKRRQEMVTYLVIIYLSFFVFLVIVAALNSILIPNLPTGASAPDSGAIGGRGPLSSIASVNPDAYTLLFFHTALVQALFSGLVAGQMGEQSVKNGAKHATAMLAIAYVVFLLLP